MKNIFKYFLILFIILFIISCTKDEEEESSSSSSSSSSSDTWSGTQQLGTSENDYGMGITMDSSDNI